MEPIKNGKALRHVCAWVLMTGSKGKSCVETEVRDLTGACSRSAITDAISSITASAGGVGSEDYRRGETLS